MLLSAVSRLLVSLVLSLALFACPPAPEPPCDGGDCAPVVLTPGCDAGTFLEVSGACRPAGATTCGPGFEVDPSGWGCESVVQACDAGASSVPGEGCAPLGWTTCPAGFTRDASGWSCEPTLPPTPCTGATRTALGASTCAPVGDCAAAFPPAGATLFVDASLDAGAIDATHFTTITSAIAAAAPGAIISVAAGTYRESLSTPRPVTLLGRCAAQVQLIGDPALFVDGVQGVRVEGFTLRDSLLAARVERAGGLTLRHVVLEANLRSAVQALDPGTQVTLEDVVVRDTRADPATQTFGQGLAASFGAQVTLTDVELSGNLETGLFLDRAQTAATVTRTVVSNTLPRASTGRLGWGVAVQRGARLDATGLVVQDSRTTGLVVVQSPSSATLKDTLVRRTALGLDNTGQPSGIGVAVLQGGTLTWTGGAVDGSPGSLVHAQDPGSVATLRDVTVRGVRPVTGVPSSGIDAESSAKVTLERVAVLDTAGTGVFASSRGEVTIDHLAVLDVAGVGLRAQGGSLTGVAVEVRRHSDAAALASQAGSLTLTRCVLADATADPGMGAASQQGSLLVLEQCLVAGNASAGVYATTPTATALVGTSVIRDTRLTTAGEYGQGVVVERGGFAQLTDVTVARNHTAGLQVADAASELRATRVTVRSTQPNGAGTRGRGANALFGAQLQVTDSAFVDNQQVGLFVFQARVEVTDSLVRATRSDPDGSYGNGLEALTDGVIVFTRGAVEGSPGIAAVFAEGAGVLDGARVAKNAVGLHAQDGSTVEELAAPPPTLGARQVIVTTGTAFEENQAKLSAGTVPVPPP
jgi:hypothetical protein